MHRVVAVASGKGGTGKTTVATNLSVLLGTNGGAATYVDCDVEEPNGHIFLKPVLTSASLVEVNVPEVDSTVCDGCGECGEICEFSAIVSVNGNTVTFPDLCHSCGGCFWVCPKRAITEKPKQLGTVEIGRAGEVGFVQGRLRVGEPRAAPLVREVKRRIPNDGFSVIDSPPGTSCPVIEAVKDADYVVLVTEPTPFGLNDLKIAVETVRELDLPCGVVINRHNCGDDSVRRYCKEQSIAVLLEIPESREIAEAYSRGHLTVSALPEYRDTYQVLLDRILKEIEF
jgi:MinD superfamily P-loop ATPase